VIQINLLPGQDKRRSGPSLGAFKLPALSFGQGEPHLAVVGGIGVFALLVLTYLVWSTGSSVSALEARVQQEVRDSIDFHTTIGLTAELRAREDTIRQKIEVIRSVDERRFIWPHILDEVSAAMPPFTWLTSVGSAGAKTAPRITLTGNAGTTQALTRLMRNLEDSPFLREVTLVTTEQVTEQNRTFLRFALEAAYERPDEAMLETVPIVIVD
jgi:Tfp pilus assembly protein PilN